MIAGCSKLPPAQFNALTLSLSHLWIIHSSLSHLQNVTTHHPIVQEEKIVPNMQINGYENPTYKYFEVKE